MRTTILAAVAENGVIGRDGGLPWKLSTDLKRFKADTMGRPVIMGRRTWESLGQALPGRLNIVISRNHDFRADGALTAPSLDDAIALARASVDADEICIIGGGQLYALAMPIANRLRITHVLADIDGDTRFPPIDTSIWHAVSSESFGASDRDSHATCYTVYDRRTVV